MTNLGIRVEEQISTKDDALTPSFPLLAFSYYRSGFIRLAGKSTPRSMVPPAYGALLRING